MKTNLFPAKNRLKGLTVRCILRALTILQAEHFFTFRFSVQTPQQSLKSPLERKSKDKKTVRYLLNVLNAIYFNSSDIHTWMRIHRGGSSPEITGFSLVFRIVIDTENHPKLFLVLKLVRKTQCCSRRVKLSTWLSQSPSVRKNYEQRSQHRMILDISTQISYMISAFLQVSSKGVIWWHAKTLELLFFYRSLLTLETRKQN